MLRSNMMKNDFDSITSSQSTMTMVGPNGQETTISQTSEKNVEGQQKPEKEVEEFKVEEYKPNEVEQVYEDTNEKSHTYSKLNGELDSEQREVATEAKKAEDMSEFDWLLNDFSYQIGDEYPYKGTTYIISEKDDPVNGLITSDTADRYDEKEFKGALDRYIRDYGLKI